VVNTHGAFFMIDINLLKHCVSVDIETTGTDERVHGIISIGAKLFTGDEDEFYRELVIPDYCEYDPIALRVNGESEAALRARTSPEYATPLQALLELFEFCSKHEVGVIIGKNPGFDSRYLKHVWRLNGGNEDNFNKILTYRVLDWSSFIIPLLLYKGYTIPIEGFGNVDLARILKIPDEAQPHIAINGARYNVNCTKHVLKMYDESS